MAELVWEPRLITADRVFATVAGHPVTLALHHHILDQATADAVNGGPEGTGPGLDADAITEPVPTLLCGDCGQPIAHDQHAEEEPTPFTLTELAVAVLRHRVSAHEEVLSGNRTPAAG